MIEVFLFVLTQVVPVLLQGLPLKEDVEENETVFKCIVKLITAKNPVVSEQCFSAWHGLQHISTVMPHYAWTWTCTYMYVHVYMYIALL